MQIMMTKNNQFLKLGCRVENALQQFYFLLAFRSGSGISVASASFAHSVIYAYKMPNAIVV